MPIPWPGQVRKVIFCLVKGALAAAVREHMPTSDRVLRQRRFGVQLFAFMLQEQAAARNIPLPSYDWDFYARSIDDLGMTGARLIFNKGAKQRIEIALTGRELQQFGRNPTAVMAKIAEVLARFQP